MEEVVNVGNIFLRQRHLHGSRWYDYMEVIGRVEPGAETESEAGARAEDTEMKS